MFMYSIRMLYGLISLALFTACPYLLADASGTKTEPAFLPPAAAFPDWHVDFTERNSPENIANMTKRLFSYLDPGREELKPAFAALAASDYGKALALYQQVFLARSWPKHEDIGTPQLTNISNPTANADELLNQNLLRMKLGGLEAPLEIDFTPGRINWEQQAPKPALPDAIYGSYIWLSPFTPALRTKWRNAEGLQYWRKWEEIMDDFYLRNRVDYYFGFVRMTRARGILQCLKNEGGDRMDPRFFGRSMLCVIEDHLPGVFKHMYGGPCNQSIDASQTAIKLASILPELKISSRLYREGLNVMGQYPMLFCQLDGPDVENSINYMGALPNWAGKAMEISGYPKELMDALNLPMRGRLRFLVQNLTPTGQSFRIPISNLSNVAESYWIWWGKSLKSFLTEDPEIASILNLIRGTGKEKEIPFRSRAFPYSGYYYLREGWEAEAQQALFRACRRLPFRQQEDYNALILVGFEQELLCESGYAKEIGALPFYMVSSNSRNSVSVDGYGQIKMGEHIPTPKTPFQSPIPSQWLSSASFDYTEGTYDYGYGTYGKNQEQVQHHLPYVREFPAMDYKVVHIDDVSHKRQVLFIRDAKLWVVIDRLESGKAHNFTQNWHLPAPVPPNEDNQAFLRTSVPKKNARTGVLGYLPDDVHFDSEKKRLKVCNEKSSGINIWHAGIPTLKYQKYFGAENKSELWPPRRFHGWGMRWNPKADEKPHDYAPAVEITADWQGVGQQILMTAIQASKPGEQNVPSVEEVSQDGMIGLDLTFSDGRRVFLRASLQSKPLITPLVKLRSDTLAIVSHPQSQTAAGFALGTEPESAGSILDGSFTLSNGEPSLQCQMRRPVSPPHIYPESTWIYGRQTVRMECPEAQADGTQIRYTLDGSEPTFESPLYKEPISIESSTRVTAAAFRSEKFNSSIDYRFIDCSPGISRHYRVPETIEPLNPESISALPSTTELKWNLYEGNTHLPKVLCEAQLDWMFDELVAGKALASGKIAKLCQLPPETSGKEIFLLVYARRLVIDKAGAYTFYNTPYRDALVTEGCSLRLRINGQFLQSCPEAPETTAAFLPAGVYRMELFLRMGSPKVYSALKEGPVLDWAGPGFGRRKFE